MRAQWGELSQPGLKLWLPIKVINGQVQKEGQIGKVIPGQGFKSGSCLVQYFGLFKASDGNSFCDDIYLATRPL